jgi:hypothetical protein
VICVLHESEQWASGRAVATVTWPRVKKVWYVRELSRGITRNNGGFVEHGSWVTLHASRSTATSPKASKINSRGGEHGATMLMELDGVASEGSQSAFTLQMIARRLRCGLWNRTTDDGARSSN